jgi:hypothetical protein
VSAWDVAYWVVMLAILSMLVAPNTLGVRLVVNITNATAAVIRTAVGTPEGNQ